MKPSDKRKRVGLIHHIQKEAVETVYAQQHTNRLKEMAKLALENQTLQSYPLPCFMYEGQWYTYPHNYKMPPSTVGIPRLLHHSLLNRAVKIMDSDSFEDKKNRIHIKSCIGKVLSTCRCLKDIMSILPSAMLPNISADDAALLDIGEELTQGERDKLEPKIKKGLDALRIVYMTELLLAKS